MRPTDVRVALSGIFLDCGSLAAVGSFSFEVGLVVLRPIPTAGSELLTSLLMLCSPPHLALNTSRVGAVS